MRVLHLLKTSVGATWALRQVREFAKLGVQVRVALPPVGYGLSSVVAGSIVFSLIHLVWSA